MSFNHGIFMRVLREKFGPVSTQLYAALVPALEAGLTGELPSTAFEGVKPPWLVEAIKHMGLKEVAGPKHNPTILGWVKSLGGWFTDDETPWCGTFVAICMKSANQLRPKHWYRALDWASWGKPCQPAIGCVAVFGRKGGGHVGFLVGESDTHFYVLGGNQGNEVNISALAKSRLVATRWPAFTGYGQSPPSTKLPRMSGGTKSRNEA